MRRRNNICKNVGINVCILANIKKYIKAKKILYMKSFAKVNLNGQREGIIHYYT